jgi:glycosyltransferase involved in cell wall biosynthesis
MRLSIVMPAYNERGTIARVLPLVAAALPGVPKQLIIVEDYSTDGTREWLQAHFGEAPRAIAEMTATADDVVGMVDAPDAATAPLTVELVLHQENRGKGAALRTGFNRVRGDIVVIQDADLEYDPADWAGMWRLLAEQRVADVVYGSRFYGRPHRSLLFHHYLGNRVISLLFNVLYNQILTDIEVCYKMFTREVLDSLRLTADDFGIEVEMTAQMALARRWRIYELGISYYGRTFDEGKKINWRDGLKALWYVVKYRWRGPTGR